MWTTIFSMLFLLCAWGVYVCVSVCLFIRHLHFIYIKNEWIELKFMHRPEVTSYKLKIQKIVFYAKCFVFLLLLPVSATVFARLRTIPI